MANTELAPVVYGRLSDEQLTGILDEASLAAVFKEANVSGVSVSDYGNGFKVLPTSEKGRLCGVPFWIVEGQINMGDDGPFASLAIFTKPGEKLVINDGSTGVMADFERIVNLRHKEGTANPNMGIFVEGGLSRSDYYVAKDGKIYKQKPEGIETTSATTFYLAN